MKTLPCTLVNPLVEACLDQPKPSKELVEILQVILKRGDHKDRLK